MRVWILQTGEPLQIDSIGMRPMRAINLSNFLINKGHEVTLWSSDFDHFSKTHRYGNSKTIKISNAFTIQLIKSFGYKSHLGIRRIIDHAQLAWNLRALLRTKDLPDIAFIGYPPIETAWIMSRFLKKRKVPHVVDVKDAWPQIIIEKFPRFIRPLIKCLTIPYNAMMKSSLKSSSGLCSITDEFLDWSLERTGRNRNSQDIVVPLTALEARASEKEIKEAEAFWDSQGVTDDSNPRFYFVGTINDVFDFEPAIVAARRMGIEFVVAGDGPLRDFWREKTKDLPNFFFPGWITTAQALVLSNRSKAALVPVKKRADFAMSIPNKVLDAFRSGKPIVTSLEGVTQRLVTRYGVGICYSSDDLNDLSTKLLEITASEFDVKQMSDSAKKLYENKFESSNAYSNLVSHLESIADSSKV